MKIELEKWADLKVGIDADHEHFNTLSDTEIVVQGAATVESALKFLMSDGKSNLAGLIGDAAQTGAFIETERAMLDAFRNIRNYFAHKVKPSLADAELNPAFAAVEEWLLIVLRCAYRDKWETIENWYAIIEANPETYRRDIYQKSFLALKAILENKEQHLQNGVKPTVSPK